MNNIDSASVEGFGEEWSKFSYENSGNPEQDLIFSDYFGQFPLKSARKNMVCLDIGCGTGRWSALAAKFFPSIHLLDASEKALGVARSNMEKLGHGHFSFIHCPLHEFHTDTQYDAAWSLGVLHHLPDTQLALNKVASLLKPGAPFLVYLYYRFDNRPWWFRCIWSVTDMVRCVISRLPFVVRHRICDLIAILVYWPLARMSWLLEKGSCSVSWIPLSYYRDKSFYVIRTDSLDRFGTRLESRFTKSEITHMLTSAGFEKISFSPKEPFWTAVCYRGKV